MGRIVMAYWDCPSCGTQGIRGDQASCPNCGRARGEVKFYMKGHTEGATLEEDQRGSVEYVDEEKAKYINRSPDWYCSFCHSLNSDNAETCQSCGASRASSEANYFQMHEAQAAREEARREPEQPAPKKKRSMMPILLIIAVVVGLIWYLNTNQTKGDYQISSISWDRAIAIEQNVKEHEAGWNLPSGAKVTSQERRQNGTTPVLDYYRDVEVQRSRQVVDHYETYYTYQDMGNGFYEEVPHERPVYTTEYYTETVQEPVYHYEPVYQTWYEYDIWRWKTVRTATASGENHETAWPAVELGENEREGAHSEAYRVTIKDPNDNRLTVYRVKEADWRNLNPGDNVYITTRRTGANPYISNEKGEKLMDLYADR